MSVYIDGRTNIEVIQQTLDETLVDQIVCGLQVSYVSDLCFQTTAGTAYISNQRVVLALDTIIEATAGDTRLWMDNTSVLCTGCIVPAGTLKLSDIDTCTCVPTPAPRTTLYACEIINTPSGTLTTINVQSAINELSSVWTTGTRPASPILGKSGYNTDFGGVEVYQTTCRTGWLVLFGYWDVAARPTGVVIGSRGYNYELEVFEYLDSTNNWAS